MSLASWSHWWKSGRSLVAEKFAPRREAARARDRRRLQVDPLEQRQMFAVSPVGPEFGVNNSTAGDQRFVPEPIGFGFGFFGADSTRSVAIDHDGDFVVAWTSYGGQDGDGAGVFARVFDRNGAALTDDFQVNTFTTGDQRNAAVAMDADGDFVITWESSVQDPYDASTGVYARRFVMPQALGPGGQVPTAIGGAEFRVHTNQVDAQRNPAVAMNSVGQFVISWQNESQPGSFFNDVRYQVFDEDANPVQGERRANQDNFPSSLEVDSNPDVAITLDGSFVITWSVRNTIQFRAFDALGNPRTGDLRADVSDAAFVPSPFPSNNGNFGHNPRLARGPNPISNSQVSMDYAGNFIIVWQSFQDNDLVTNNDTPDSYGIYFRRFLASGAPAATRDSNVNQVHTLDPNNNNDQDPAFFPFFAGDQLHPSVSIDADGDLGIVWKGFAQTVFGNEIQTLEFQPGTNIFGTFQLQIGFITTQNIPVTNDVQAADIEAALLGIGFETFVTDLGGGNFTVEFIGTSGNQNIPEMVVANNFVFVGPPPPPPTPGVPPPPPRALATITVDTDTEGANSYDNRGIWLRRYVPAAEFPTGATITPGSVDYRVVNTTNNGPQHNPTIAYEPDGDFIVVWDGEGATDTQGIFAQRFDENTDAAGPLATEVLINGARVKTGDTIAQSAVNTVVVRFDEAMNNISKTGPFSVENPANWVLEKDNVVITGGVINIEFALNPATNKWEAVVSLDGNGSALPGPTELANGTYRLIALNSLRDAPGNPLGGSGYSPNGSSFVRSFNVQLPGPGTERLVNPASADSQVTHPETRQAVAKDYDGNGVVVWTDTDAAGDDNVFAQRFHSDALGNPVFDGAPIPVNTIVAGDQRNASVAMDADGDFVVTWSSQTPGVTPPNGGDWDIFARRFDALGTALSTNDVLDDREFRVNTHSTSGTDTHRYSSIAMDVDGDFVITWQSFGQEGAAGGYGIYAQRYRSDGSRVGGVNEIQTINFTGDITAGGNFTVQFGTNPAQTVAIDPVEPSVTAQSIEDALTPFIEVDVTANSPTSFAVTFVGADAGKDMTQLVVSDTSPNFAVSVQTTTGGVSSEFRVNDTTPRDQVEPVVSMDANGQFVVTWKSFGQGADPQNQSNVFAKLYADFENIVTAVNEVQTITFAPAIGINGAFAIQVAGATSGPVSVVGAPSFTAIRNAFTQLGFQTQVVDQGGGVFQVTFVGTSASRNIPQATIVNNTVQDGGGNTVAITPATTTDGFGAGEFLVNTNQELNNQRLPHVAMDLDGDFVITWTSYGHDNNGSGYGAGGTGEDGIFARRYSAGAFPDPTGFQVNNFSDGNQRYSSVVLDADGDFTITWTSELQDGSGYAVFGRSFQSLGTPLGSEFQVNATTANDQQFSSIANDGQGQFTIVWSGNGTGDNSGVFLREFVKAVDDAGPIVADVLYLPVATPSQRLPIHSGDTIDEALSSVIVTFGEQLDFESAQSVSNWAILRGTTPIPDGIASVTFELNPNTNKWEAVVTFTEVLQAGSYTLVARDTLFDLSLNFLDGNYDGFVGDDFQLGFTIVVGAQPQRPDTIVNPSPDGSQTTDVDSPQSIAVDADGDFVVVWTDSSSGTSDIFARRFNAQGTPQGPSQIPVNTTTAGNQSRAAVAIDADGDFIVTWTDYNADATGNVMARRFDALGVALGTEFLVNTSGGAQTRSSVAVDVNGDFVITWIAGDGNGEGVFARRFNFVGDSQGNEFRVNTTILGAQRQAQVAMNAQGGFTVVWSGSGVDAVTAQADAQGIFARRFLSDGTPVSGEILVNTTTGGSQTLPRVASTLGGEVAVTWTSFGQDGSQEGVFFQLFAQGGAPLGVETQANVTTDGSQKESAVAFDHLGNFTVVWSGNGANLQGNNDDEGIFARRFDAAGAPLLPPGGVTGTVDEFRVNTTTLGIQFAPYVGASGAGDLFFAWTSVNPNNPTIGADVYRRQFDELGDLAGPIVADVLFVDQQLNINSPGSPPDVLDGSVTELTVTFGEQMSVAGGTTGPNSIQNPANWILTRNGTAIPGAVSAVSFSFDAASGKYVADLILDGNGFAGAGAPALLQGNYVLTLRESARDVFDNSLDGDYNNVPGGNFTVNFTVGTQVVGTDGVVNPNPIGNQTTSVDSPQSIAVDADGDHVIVWTDTSSGQGDIFARRFNALGVPQGPPQILVNAELEGSQAFAAVAMDADGDFIVTWTDYNDDAQGNIMARRFDALGVARGAEFIVNSSAGVQTRSSIAVDVNGDFVITWIGDDGNGDGVFAQRYNSLEERQGGEFQVNTTVAIDQHQAQVAMSALGGFVVTWSGFGFDTVNNQVLDGQGIFAQRYGANGAPILGEVLVNTTIGGAQTLPRVARSLNGDYVITWTSAGQDGSQEGVYFQRFDQFGNPLGGETQANVTTDGVQSESAVAFDHLGNFTIAWSGNGAGLAGATDDQGIFARRFDNNGGSLPPPGGVTGAADEFRVNTTTPGSQMTAYVGASGAGDLYFAWTSIDPNDGNAEVFRRQFDELGDLAGPIVADVLTTTLTSGPRQVRPGDVLDLTVSQLTVTFGEQMSVTGGPAGANSIQNTNNWVLTRNGSAVAGAVASVAFNFNSISGKWEGLLGLDGNGFVGAGSPALPEGAYTLTLRDTAHDSSDNSLDGNFNNTPGGNFTINFVIAPAPVPEFLVNTFTPNSQHTSPESQKAIGVDADGDFVVVWTSSGQDGSGDGVFAQRFNALGQKLGGEILVANTTAFDQRNAAVAVDADGDFVVTWTSYGQNNDASAQGNIYARRFSANGQARGNEILVNATTDFSQRWSSVAIDVDGDFVVTWTGYDTNGDGVFAQRFSSLGDRLEGEIPVNQVTTGSQRLSRVALDADGDFVVVWLTVDPTQPQFDLISARKFNADGSDLLDPVTQLPVGEFRVAPGNTGFEEVSVAMDLAGDFVVAFRGTLVATQGAAVGAQVYNAQAVAQTGALLVSSPTLTGEQRHPSVAMDHNGDFVVTWSGFGDQSNQQDDYGVFARRFDRLGNSLPPPPTVFNAVDEFRVNTSVAGVQQVPSVGLSGKGDIVIVWTSTPPNGSADVFARQFTIPGDNTGPIVADVLTGNTQVVPGATISGNVTQLTVTFGERMTTGNANSTLNATTPANYELIRNGVPIAGAVTAVAFSLNAATNKWEAVLTIDGNGTGAGTPALLEGSYVLRIPATMTDAAGNILDGDFNGVPQGPFTRPFLIAGVVPPGPPGTPRGDEFRVNTNLALRQETSDIAGDATGGFVIVWSSFGQDGDAIPDTNIYGQLFNSNGARVGAEFRVNRSPAGGLVNLETGNQADPAVAMNSVGDFVVVWAGVGTGEGQDRHGVYAQRFNRFGTSSGNPILVNPIDNTNIQSQPAVAIDDLGTFVVTWTTNGSQDDVIAQRFDSQGARLGGPITVNTNSTDRQEQSRVAMDADGDFVVTWDSYGQDGGSWGVFAQRFSSSGAPQNGNFQVNQFNTNAQRDSSVAMDPVGNFVITWTSFNQDGGGYGVVARRYSAAGGAQGNEFQVNTTTANHQRFSDVDIGPTGHFVVTWTSFGQDTDVNGIYGRGFAPNGASLGGEFSVNRVVAGEQTSSEIAMDAAGHFVVAWTTPDTDTTGISARRFFSFASSVAGGPTSSTVGLFAPAASGFLLKNSNSAGPADVVFGFGPAGSGWQPITGDWDGDGFDTAGLYSPTQGAFFLKNGHAPGAADVAFFFGAANNGGVIAVAGDWNGDGIDTIGLYDRNAGAFFLRNSNDTGVGDEAFFFGPGGTNWLPIAGNWDAAGGDTVGLYSPDNSAFFLRNIHAPGAADLAFFYGPAGAGWLPVAGDWNGDGSDTIGLFSQGSSTFFLRNSNSTGIGEIVFGYGPAGSNWLPIAGDWNGPAGSPQLLDGAAVFGGQQSALTGGELQPIVDEALARWAVAGLTSAQMATLRGANIQVTDLPGRYLGVALDNTIYIDRDAAGRGWFIDATPAADEEFTGGISADADIYRHVDLLTVVSHELGHLLGLEDLDPLGHEADLMAATLATGHRRLPTESALDAVFADESW